MVDTVLLDFYGTIAAYGDMRRGEERTWQGFYARLRRERPELEYETFLDAWRAEYSRSLRLDELTETSVFTTKIARACRRCGVELDSAAVGEIADACLETWHGYISLPRDVHQVLGALRREHALGLVSNFDHPAYLRGLLRRSEVEPFFDAVVISGEIGVDKPHPDIFRRALDALGTTAERAVFVGDSLRDDIEGAVGVGCHPVLIDMKDRFGDYSGWRIRKLSELLDLVPTIRDHALRGGGAAR